MDDDKEFDYLRGQSPEQQEAADDVEPRVEDSPQEVGSGEDKNGERAREPQAGL
ncbi:MAG: hypothetical protein ACJ762_08800 [Solirubrobacteraceae bacterium]